MSTCFLGLAARSLSSTSYLLSTLEFLSFLHQVPLICSRSVRVLSCSSRDPAYSRFSPSLTIPSVLQWPSNTSFPSASCTCLRCQLSLHLVHPLTWTIAAAPKELLPQPTLFHQKELLKTRQMSHMPYYKAQMAQRKGQTPGRHRYNLPTTIPRPPLQYQR